MSAAKTSDGEFVELVEKYGVAETARKLGIARRNVSQRRQRIERRTGKKVETPEGPRRRPRVILPPQASHRVELTIPEGCVIIASDMHLWPGEVSLVFRALRAFVKELRPRGLVLNGDVMDLPRASRHAAIGWEKRPEIHEEIEWAQEALFPFEKEASRGCTLVWNLGNHDSRFESRIANLAPEYAKVHGVHLKDHFPQWQGAWSTVINNEVLVKHRFRGGIHAVHNNLLWSGMSCVTGHLHSAQVRPLTYYDERTIWGMDTGCVAEPSARTFIDYTEDNPKNWRSAFGVLTFVGGRLLQPELVLKFDPDSVQWRGKVIRVT